MYNFHSLALFGSIFLLHLVTLSYGQRPDEENDTGPTRKRPILRKIIILVGLAIGFAALCWAIHKSYKAYCRWSQKRRRLVGRKEFDAMMEDLEKQEMELSGQKEGQGSDPADSSNGKYMPLNNTSPEEEPLMTSVEGSPERASQHVSDSDSKTKEKGDASTPLLYNVPLDDSDPLGNPKLNMTEQGAVGEHCIEPSAPPEEER